MTNARIPPLPREEWTEEARDVFAFWEGPSARENGSKSLTMMVQANHPKLAMAQLEFGKYLITQSTLSARQKELVVMRVAWRFDSLYQWAHHVVSSRRNNVLTDDEIRALKQTELTDLWSEVDRVVLSTIDQLCNRAKVDDETWEMLTRHLSRHQVMDLLYATGFFAMNAWAFTAMGVPLEAGYESVPDAML